VTDDNPPFVFESDYVGALMDTGKAIIALNNEAKRLGNDRFGQGTHDFVGNERLDNVEDTAATILANDPGAWSSVARASLIMAQGAENDQQLAERVQHLAAITIAWLTDIRNRTPIGLDK
jgi:hypothetical protein